MGFLGLVRLDSYHYHIPTSADCCSTLEPHACLAIYSNKPLWSRHVSGSAVNLSKDPALFPAFLILDPCLQCFYGRQGKATTQSLLLTLPAPPQGRVRARLRPGQVSQDPAS
ncbi:hypothetical protein CCACVL1_08826 [Corchorus capsularis]|uniref:Uncharacterized protein n=1 Tax=Corchorus capsularis TaxID=210143 RepID=A0A1R3IYM5_COCAP|nr:hypothetical protein CCACVL1_08826 [Corchorus capsularis]